MLKKKISNFFTKNLFKNKLHIIDGRKLISSNNVIEDLTFTQLKNLEIINNLTNEDFIRIKRLLKKSPYAELKISLKTASALNPKNKNRINELFSKEINKRDLIVNKK